MEKRVYPRWGAAVLCVVLGGCADDPVTHPFQAPGLGTTSGANASTGTDEEDTDGRADSGPDGDGDDTDAGGDATGDEVIRTPATGISVTEVDANQAVAITLATEGMPRPPSGRNGELIFGRPTLVRAQWALDAGFAPREIRALLEVTAGDGSIESFEDLRWVDGPANPLAMDGTFVWELPAEAVQPGTSYQIHLLESDGSSRGEATTGASFPASGPADLGISADRMEMKLVLIPVTTPEGGVTLSDELVKVFTDRMLATYPLQKIEVQTRPPWVNAARVSNLDSAFNYLTQLRAQEGASYDVYYHLIMDYETCCSGTEMESFGGIAYIADETQLLPRDGITKTSSDLPEYWELDAETLTHEIGHNHGRDHAPCGDPGQPDPAYPYAGADIGVVGYDIDHMALIDPTLVDAEYGNTVKDFMSYCYPRWWSDYSWQALVDRVRIMTQAQAAAPAPWNHEVLRGFLHADGSVTWSRVPAPHVESPTSGTGTVRLLGTDGGIIAESTVHEHRIADSNVRVIEADIPSRSAFERFEVDLDRGPRFEARGTDVRNLVGNLTAQ